VQSVIGTKIFLYPDAFEKFLKALNPAVENNVMEECRIKQEQIEQELERVEKERQAAVIAQGTPEEIAVNPNSYSGKYLKKHLK
jgi:hypothetical protein